MSNRQKIEMALAYIHMTKAELARRIGWTPQMLQGRLESGKFTEADWARIGEAIGAKVETSIIFPDGTKIGD